MPKNSGINDEYTQLDLFSSNFKKNAYNFYAKLRTSDPIHRFTFPNGQTAWLITRYEDAIVVLKDSRFIKNPYTLFSSEQIKQLLPIMETDILMNHMLNSDPPDHNRLRKLVHKAFTLRTIEELRETIQEISDDLLDKVKDKKDIELISDFAFPLPIMVICKMLGIPAEDHKQFREWSNAVVEASNLPEKMHESIPKINSFINYLSELIKVRRNNPSNDLITALISNESKEEQLTEKEMYSMIFLLIVAGHETTVNLIGNGILALLQHPEELEKLKNNPNLIQPAVEELLRFYSPVELTTNRWASEEIVFQNKVIQKGDMVVVSLASANRDERQFKDPEKLNITRKNNPHLAFGMGIHFCLGAPLARLEGQIAINTLLRKMPNMQLNAHLETLVWRPTYLMRGLIELPITI
ncbi:cytochrome P450 [Bacillus sp. JJ864]|uniref:cytochrome P450 family protein n=1 Tax=Bacillus sp. JJ864 TaxID=3122975 RepID=UPI0030007595